MIISLSALISVAIALVFPVSAGKNLRILPNGIKVIEGAPSGALYYYIPFALAVNRHDANLACAALSLTLAPIPTLEDLLHLGGLIKEEAWIGSFRGAFEGECVAAFRGGAIAVPVGDCNSNHAVLCRE